MKKALGAAALGALLASGAAFAYPNGTPDRAQGAHGANPNFSPTGGLGGPDERRDAEVDPRAYHGPYDPWRSRAYD